MITVKEMVGRDIDKDKEILPVVTSSVVRPNKAKENPNKRVSKRKKSVTKPKVPTNLQKPRALTKSVKPKKAALSPASSFLVSLSEVTGDIPFHPEAQAFKQSFKNKKNLLLKKLFSLYNQEFFENKLPHDLPFEWSNRLRCTSGYCKTKSSFIGGQTFRSCTIVLSSKVLDRAARLRDTLIHELCHAAVWIIDGLSEKHGSTWKAWTNKFNNRFPELPVIKRRHSYAIRKKYLYQCTCCKYNLERDVKFPDLKYKRCGHCFGSLKLFMTSRMSCATAQTIANSRMLKNPTTLSRLAKKNLEEIKTLHKSLQFLNVRQARKVLGQITT